MLKKKLTNTSNNMEKMRTFTLHESTVVQQTNKIVYSKMNFCNMKLVQINYIAMVALIFFFSLRICNYVFPTNSCN